MDAVENIKWTGAGSAQGSRLAPGIECPSLAAFPPDLTGPRASQRILLVDDDSSFRNSQARLLRSQGYAVFEATDGKEAERVFLRNHPDLIITDMSMPGRDGLETIRCLGEIDPLVPVIAMSGSGRLIRGDYLAFAHYLGAVRTLEKPFSFEELLAAIRVALPRSGSSLELAE
jgi:DNA-binding response OmpR family regulator